MPIPKKIHYCWFGNGEKNELVKKCIASWEKYCPDCEIIEWNEFNYDISLNLYMKQAYEAKRWGFVSDYARLDIIYEQGGIYLDTDVEVIKPLDKIFEGHGFFGFEKPLVEKKENYLVNTGQGFGAERYNDVVLLMRNLYNEISFYDSEGKQNLTTSPNYNTAVLEKLGLKKDNTLQVIQDMTIYPDEYFCPFNWKTKEIIVTDRTFTIHHFNASWLSDEEKKKRKIERCKDYIIHMPNMFLQKLIGKKEYEKIKKIIKKQ